MSKTTMRVCGSAAILAVVFLAGCFGPIVRPIADFAWCPDGGEGRLDYWFSSTSTTVPGHWIEELEWDFGDGSPTSMYDGFHRFDEEGLYAVTLTVVDSRGVAGTTTKQVPIEFAVFVQPTWQLILGFPITVSGIVENRYSERLNRVVVRAKFYDPDGVRLTDGRFEIIDLEPGEKAAFEIRAEEFDARIFYATVDIESFSTDCDPWRTVLE